MLTKSKLPLLVTFILLLNVLIYFRAAATIVPADWIFGECARNSGRTSALINLILLFMLGHYGLKAIYKEKRKLNAFRILLTLFAVNHLIHFFFVSQNFRVQFMDLNLSNNIHGFITFILVILVPIVVWRAKQLTNLLYFGVILHIINVTYFIAITFYGRYKPEDPAYLHRIGVLVMIGAVLYVLYRMFMEKMYVMKSDKPLSN